MQETYRTRSLMFAAFALLQGVKVVDVIPSEGNDRCVILLEPEGAALADDIYYNQNPAVHIHDLAKARATVFDLIRAKRAEVAA